MSTPTDDSNDATPPGHSPLPVYPQPGHPPAERPAAPSNWMGTASLVLGILAVLFGILFFPVGILFALVGIGLGFAGRARAKRGVASNGGTATAGLALSVLGLLIAIAAAFFVGYLFNQIEECTDPSLSQTEREQCVRDEINA